MITAPTLTEHVSLRYHRNSYRNGVSPGHGARSLVNGREISQIVLIERGTPPLLSHQRRLHRLLPARASVLGLQNRRAYAPVLICHSTSALPQRRWSVVVPCAG